MEHNISIGGQVVISCPDLVKAASLFLEAFTKGTHVEASPIVQTEKKVNNIEPLSGTGEVVAMLDTDTNTYTSTLIDTSTVGMAESRHPGIAANGKPYGQFKEMTDLFDVLISMGCKIEVKTILDIHSQDGTYGGIAPKDWNATIVDAQKMIDARKKGSAKGAKENKVAKILTMEDVRTTAREVQEKKGKEVLLQIFKSFGKLKLSEFSQVEYTPLMNKFQEVL